MQGIFMLLKKTFKSTSTVIKILLPKQAMAVNLVRQVPVQFLLPIVKMVSG